MLVQPEGLGTTLESIVATSGLRFEPFVRRWSLKSLSLGVACADIAILVSAFLLAAFNVESYTLDLSFPDPSRPAAWCLVLVAIWLPVTINQGAYGQSVIGHSLRSPYIVAKSTIVAGALFHVLPLVGGPVYSRTASLTVVLALVFALSLWRYALSFVLWAPARTPSDIIVVGAGWAGQALADAIIGQPRAGVRIRAFVDWAPDVVGTSLRGVAVHGVDELPRLARALRHPRIVLALPEEAHASVYEQLTTLAQAGVEVGTMAALYEEVTGRIPVRHLGSLWWAILPKPTSDIVYLGVKRLTDIGLAVAGLVLLVLLLPVLGVLLKLETGGLLFTQERVGRYGRPLKLVKLRTLRPQAGPYSSYWERKAANKPAVIGALVRATGLDELPQCWNVLKGEMSVVGPRPYVPEEVADFQRDIPFFRCRSLIKPGLTGWAQVNWGYGLSLEDEIEKLQYDLFYMGHQSFYLDLLIILKTIGFAFRRTRPKGLSSSA